MSIHVSAFVNSSLPANVNGLIVGDDISICFGKLFSIRDIMFDKGLSLRMESLPFSSSSVNLGVKEVRKENVSKNFDKCIYMG